ncbi:hypothetical protein LX14_002211 [Williamsia deligens]|nr:hypothetical protein [Williamsia deligens]
MFFTGWMILATGPDGNVSNPDGLPLEFRGQISYEVGPGQSCGSVAREHHEVRITASAVRTVRLGQGVVSDGFCIYKFAVAGPFAGRSAVVRYDGQDRRVVLRDGLSIGGVFLLGDST